MNTINGRPLVSVFLVAYRQEKYIREAVRSLLSQTYSPLEVLLSDDCSSDGTYEIMKAEAGAYAGPHRIILNRNSANMGLAGHLNRAWELTTGEFAVVQAGDDISKEDRVEKMVDRWQRSSPKVDLVCSYFDEIDEGGKLTGFTKKSVVFTPRLDQSALKWRCGATGGCASYTRRIHEKYGPLDPAVISEDWVYSFRAWVESGIALIEEPLVLHRTHARSLSVQHRLVSRAPSRETRRRLRLAAARNQLAIVTDWRRSWKLGRFGTDPLIERDLDRLCRIASLKVEAFGMSGLKAIKSALLVLANGGGARAFLQVVYRDVLCFH